MSFIALLICICLERFWDGVADLRNYDWFVAYKGLLNQHLGDKSFWQGYVKMAGLILPILLVMLIVSLIFSAMLGGIGSVIFSVLILAYCIGPHNIYAEIKQCVAKNEDGSARLVTEKAHAFFGTDPSLDDRAARLQLSQAILTVANRRVFVMCFWFGVLGPLGALLYRLIALCAEDDGLHAQAEWIQAVLDWPSARVLALAYAITGNFMGVFPVFMKHALDGIEKNGEVLKASTRGAFGITDSNESTQDIDPRQASNLLDRALGAWVLVVLIFNIIY